MRSRAAVLLLLLSVAAAAGASLELEERRRGFYLQHHTFEWIKGRPELQPPPELEGICDQPVIMNLSATEVEDPLTGERVKTRAFNGVVPGPTWRVRPGCRIDLTIFNSLGPASPNCSVTNEQPNQPPIINGSYCYLNWTNVHTHGLHVSSAEPSDSIFIRLAPQNWKQWIFDIPKNHMGGTHWYHPHLHHATASQAGGGAAGMIIVEDAPGSVPHYVAQMEEKILTFLALDFQLQASIEQQGMGTYFWQTTSKTNALLVNGMHQPKITLTQGKWYRFRMLFSSIEMQLQMTNRGSAWCTTKLLSKDGVWLDIAPRSLTGFGKKPVPIQLGPANRADIAIACTCPFPHQGCYSEFYSLQNCTEEARGIDASDEAVEQYNEAYHNSTPAKDDYTPCDPFQSRRRRACEGLPETPMIDTWGPLQPPRCGFGRRADNPGQLQRGPGLGNPAEDDFYGMKMHKLEHGLLDSFNGTIFSVVVEPTWMPRRFWHPAWKFSVRRPCYLVDLRRAVIEPSTQRHIEFYGAGYEENALLLPPGPVAGMYPNSTHPDIPPNPDHVEPIARKFVDPPIPDAYGPPLPMGQAIEWAVGGIAFHPFHLHITPFQVQNITGTPDAWLQPGDWQDTLLNSLSNCNNSGRPCPLYEQQEAVPGAPNPGDAGSTFVRFWTDQFPGVYISHCHLLTHEDEGMMFWVNVSGEEGTVPAQAKQLDPSCYTGALEGWGFRWRHPFAAAREAKLEAQQRQRRLRSIRRHDEGAETDESVYLQGYSSKEFLWGEEEEEEEEEVSSSSNEL